MTQMFAHHACGMWRSGFILNIFMLLYDFVIISTYKRSELIIQ